MASIWKHEKSKNWYARFRAADGRWVNRSTGTSDKSEAERIADTWAINAAREREKTVPDVSPAGISDAVSRAERLARLGRLDASAARNLINDLLQAAGHESLDAVTNKSWCDSWRASKDGAVKQKSRWKYAQVCRDWLRFLSAKAEKPLEVVGKPEAVAFRDQLATQGLSPRTVNQTVKLLRGIYQDAVEQGHIGRNPFAGIDRIREDRDDTHREPFSVSEVQALIAAAKGDWKGLVILGATTGLRLMDAARLQWKNVHLDEGLIRVKTSKTGARLVLPIHADFARWLAEQERGIGIAPVFPELAHKSGAGKSGLSCEFKGLMKRANVSAGVARLRQGRGRTISKKSFHSLRHFTATQFAADGVRAEIARAITGHADAEVHANYVTPDIEALRNAVRTIRLSA